MVSPNSPSNPNNIHQFLISNPNNYQSQPFDSFGVDLRNLDPYPPQSLTSIDFFQAPAISNEPEINQIQKHSQYSSSSSSFNQDSYGFCGTVKSRFLKPAQLLLEEIVGVNGKDVELTNKSYVHKLSNSGPHGSVRLKMEFCSNGGLSMEKQELQATLAKLISLLEELERRYERYYKQLEEVVSSFELHAGLGSGRSYTALALNAMSGHFSGLKEAILAQIYATRKKIMRDYPVINTGFSQLSLNDKEPTRHNRMALQQLGMIAGPRQTWRPIRGLPETSVMILRSWLFEHFLHPYPNDNEKLMLASQTGLSKNQVSNWFINARVRLWKPMIEDMYKEEFADSSEDSNM